jgi:hypothetical protein
MGVSDIAKNVIPLKFLRKIKNKFFFPLVNPIRGHTVDEIEDDTSRILTPTQARFIGNNDDLTCSAAIRTSRIS